MSDQTEPEDKRPFIEHLEELRHRLIVCFIAIAIGFVVCFAIKEWLFHILSAPLVAVMEPGEKLIYTGLPEAFFTYMKLAFLAGVVLSSPVIIYQFWMFVAPGLYTTERRMLLPILLLSSLFFISGAMFGYFVVFPIGFQYFLGFGTDTIRPLLSMKEYLSLATTFLFAFGLIFELPLVLIFLVKLGVISIEFLQKQRKFAILIIFIVAAILTPPDVVSQILMAIPMMILYEFSIIGAKIFVRRPVRKNAAETEEHSETDA
ncbi:twin-arginine translocase subunit TatC [Desulfatirhabdium butyrativorans]|uniref:twin-arginine translocase subunit TatC n=1 Tax=Desulfatirhabdium butyrativorans TaxID=340467 RepID=UPI0003F8E57C|nr:twin-arginine translocase subunit TatC [Desulfatirhabdium butyrativorans]